MSFWRRIHFAKLKKRRKIVGSVPQARRMRGMWPSYLLGYDARHLTIARTGALITEFPRRRAFAR
jgi:hypothetical protein